jgi:hypothetical protein
MSEKSRTNVKILRFKNGDTIICSLSVDNNFQEYCYLLESPMQINMLPVVSKKGIQSMTIFMQEWMEYSKDHLFAIPDDVIMLICSPEEELILDYLDAIEQTDLIKVQQDFDSIAKNYLGENGDEDDDNPQDIGYNPNKIFEEGLKGSDQLGGFPYPDDDIDDDDEEDEFDQPDRPDD